MSSSDRISLSDLPSSVVFENAQEMLAFTYEGRQLRAPEDGAWIAFDCPVCSTHTETSIRSGRIECDGCGADSRVI